MKRTPEHLYIQFQFGFEVDVWKMAKIASQSKEYRTKSAFIWAIWGA